MIDFPHSPPEEYSYEFENFNSRLIAIWMRHSYSYSFADGKSIRTIWGFHSPKKNEYFAPINSKKPGKAVHISDTTPYTAMQLKQTPLERAFA